MICGLGGMRIMVRMVRCLFLGLFSCCSSIIACGSCHVRCHAVYGEREKDRCVMLCDLGSVGYSVVCAMMCVLMDHA